MLRNRGYSTWLLKAAIIQPKVFIVAKDQRSREFLINKYTELSNEYVRLSTEEGIELPLSKYWPKFIIMNNVEQSIIGYDQYIPVLFDNSCFF